MKNRKRKEKKEMKRFSLAVTWLAVACLVTMVSCRKPVVGFSGDGRAVTISAVTESGNGSKTAIEGLKVNWSEGDVISMNGCELTLKEGTGTTEGVFEGTVIGEAPYYVGYPAGATTHEGATLKLNIPATMTYEAGKVAVPMVAVTSSVEGGLEFHNAVNMLKLKLKGKNTDDTDASKLKSIVLTSTTSNLNGKINVTFNGETPEFAAIADGAKKMTVSFGGLQLTSEATTEVYIPLAKINGGDLTVRFNCANGKYMEKKVTATEAFNAVNNMLSALELTVKATYETVNMGLPVPYDKLEWSKYNLGVDPDDLDAAADWYGDYYAWGETETKSDYGWNTYKWCNGSYNTLTKYCTDSKYGTVDNKTVLDLEDDAARANWGGGWRMPTSAEWKALYEYNTFEWLAAGAPSINVPSFNAVAAGYLVIKGKESSLDRSVYMFIPAAGCRNGTSLSDAGSYGGYWSSTLNSYASGGAYSVDFGNGYVYTQNGSVRTAGLSVRPVR
ncbi:MAG: DUF1566 domain-containing protein [Bacteroidales bacterium]|nr:DUF1566 domain-containing protein [Bacteroidales bacterium]